MNVMEATLLDGFPAIVEHPVSWGDMDAFGHVNNVVYFHYFESARLDYFRRMNCFSLGRPAGIGPIIHSTQCRFRRALTWPDTIAIGCRVTEIGPDRFTVSYRIVSRTANVIAADGSAIIVMFDYDAGVKAVMPAAVREAIERVEAAVSSPPVS
jgi:acyl-CoA thioester hydrolase